MTDEERQKLCADLRDNHTPILPHHLKLAADEIERLAVRNEGLRVALARIAMLCRDYGAASQ